MILIPSIDLRNGRCVRLLQGDFDRETRYDLEPHELLQRYRALGATWLHVVDLDGAKDGRLANRSVIIRLASQKALHVQVGGGVRSKAVVFKRLHLRSLVFLSSRRRFVHLPLSTSMNSSCVSHRKQAGRISVTSS